MADPTGFMRYSRETPSRREPSERVGDWKEFYRPLPEPKLREQSSRCMDCGVPFCQSFTGCPVENRIPDWNELVQAGNWKEALDSLHATNNFPEFTGKLCPAPCESACVLGINSDPVSIRAIESSIIDRGFEEGWVTPLRASRATGRRVALIGSGPAGLAAAQQLARSGHAVTVFEKADLPGGLLRYGIPEFKMEKRILDRRLAQLEAEGVEFVTGVEIGRQLELEKLRSEYDAVGFALGAEVPRDIELPGRELAGITRAMDFLVAQNRGSLEHDTRGSRVVILGGGDTGSDCVGTALRQDAREVLQFELQPKPPLARSSATPWPLWPMQLRTSHAHAEGGVREWSMATRAFLGDKRGHVRGLLVRRLDTGEELEFPADRVILAAGFVGPTRYPWLEATGLRLNDRGCIVTDAQGRTAVPGLFAAGDVKRGASLIVWAIADGRRMASAIQEYLL